MKKIAYDPTTTSAIRLGTHVLGGAAIGGYAGHRDNKLNKRKGRAASSRITGSAIGGAITGGALGISHDLFTPKFDPAQVRAAKEQIKSVGHRFYDVHRQVGTAGGALLGGVHGYTKAKRENKEHKRKVDPWASAAAHAGLGASVGHSLGSIARGAHVNKLLRKPAAPKVPDWLKGVKTKAEAKSAYRAQARKHHPDVGGDPEKFKQVSQDWEGFEKEHFSKLGHVLNGFFNELAFIKG